jgi:hypothetical protein
MLERNEWYENKNVRERDHRLRPCWPAMPLDWCSRKQALTNEHCLDGNRHWHSGRPDMSWLSDMILQEKTRPCHWVWPGVQDEHKVENKRSFLAVMNCFLEYDVRSTNTALASAVTACRRCQCRCRAWREVFCFLDCFRLVLHFLVIRINHYFPFCDCYLLFCAMHVFSEN